MTLQRLTACLVTRRRSQRLYFHLDFGSEVGETDIAEKEEINAVAKDFKQAERRIRDIQKQHRYHKATEERFHQISLSTNRKILVWSAIQVFRVNQKEEKRKTIFCHFITIFCLLV